MSLTDAVALAKRDTLAEIQLLHPRRVRGHQLSESWVHIAKSDKYNKISYRSGSGVNIPVMFYSDYFARWEITGAFGRMILRGKRKGEYGPTYSSKSDFYQQNMQFINDFFVNRVKSYIVKEWR